MIINIPSPEEVEQAKTKNGGWTRTILAEWGIGWPPPKGWKKELYKKYQRIVANNFSNKK
jgi:hypothetical protein